MWMEQDPSEQSQTTSTWTAWGLAWAAAVYRYVPGHVISHDYHVTCHVVQVTFQACDLQEARLLYDQLAVICPMMVYKNVTCMYT